MPAPEPVEAGPAATALQAAAIAGTIVALGADAPPA
jgi:hypothetical protein